MTENIEDRIALQDVMTRYAIAVDDKDYEGYRVLFTEDVHVLGLTPKAVSYTHLTLPTKA